VTPDDISALILNSPVARSLAVIGDRWTFLILRDAFLGVRRFEDLRRRSGAARGTLSSRLSKLLDNDILYKKPYQASPVRHEYRLTQKGLGIYSFVLAVWDWETRWSKESSIPPALTHKRCGHTMRPVFRCGACHQPIRLHEVIYSPARVLAKADKLPPRSQRRSKSSPTSGSGVDRRFFHVLDVIGDRWTGLVLAALYFGLNYYDEIGAGLGIATNILSDRLKLLTRVGVVQRVRCQDQPGRYRYRLTEKGADLYASALQMHEWAMVWLVEKNRQTVNLKHLPCNRKLKSEVVCSACDGALIASEVSYQWNL